MGAAPEVPTTSFPIEDEVEIDDSIEHPCQRCGEMTDGYSCNDCWTTYYSPLFNSH